jgi:hypothetical protein
MSPPTWLPLISPAFLSPGQISGRRCAVPNCRRPIFLAASFTAGVLPDGRSVRVCLECAPGVRYEPVQERSDKKEAA